MSANVLMGNVGVRSASLSIAPPESTVATRVQAVECSSHVGCCEGSVANSKWL